MLCKKPSIYQNHYVLSLYHPNTTTLSAASYGLFICKRTLQCIIDLKDISLECMLGYCYKCIFVRPHYYFIYVDEENKTKLTDVVVWLTGEVRVEGEPKLKLLIKNIKLKLYNQHAKKNNKDGLDKWIVLHRPGTNLQPIVEDVQIIGKQCQTYHGKW